MLKGGEIDVITFTSSSAVKNFISCFDRNERKMLKGVAIASIGPVTARTVKESGLKSDIVSDRYTIERFTEKIIEYFKTA